LFSFFFLVLLLFPRLSLERFLDSYGGFLHNEVFCVGIAVGIVVNWPGNQLHYE
jgi:hypothetical protein